jgi:uncharacterized protein (TIGR03437 family)
MKSFFATAAARAMFTAAQLLILIAAAGTISLADDFSNGQAARLVIGQSTFTQSSEGAQDILIGSAAGVAYGNGNLYVVDANHFTADPNNNRVLIFPTNTFPKPTDELAGPPFQPSPNNYNCYVCVGKANIVLGQPDYNNNAVNLSQSGFRSPVGVTTDGVKLIVADTDNNRVMIWNSLPTTINQPADVVIGQPDFSHNNTSNPPTATSMRGPQGVWLADGKLYVADTQDNRVLIYNSVPTKNGAAADVVIGQPNLTTPVPTLQTLFTPSATSLYSPVSVTTDGVRMFVTDLGSNRVLIWNKIPTTNQVAADVVLGQKDFASGIADDTVNNCASTGTDTSGNAIYPQLCATTMSFPRFALSNGTSLFVADGGNDRVLIYSTIPTVSNTPPDKVLGQVDFLTDNASDGASHMYTPTSLAWDGTNLYVADCFNRRVLAYSAGANLLPLSAVRNSASLEVFASGTITIGGAITANDTVTVTIARVDGNGNTVNTKDYVYTVQANDALSDIVTGLVTLINAVPGDPNATAIGNTAGDTILLTAKTGGTNGTLVNYSTAVSTNATVTATTAGTSLTINLADATQIAPGSLITIFGTGFSDTTTYGQPDNGGYYPFALAGVEVYIDGIRSPIVSVTPTQVNAQMPYPVFDRTSSSVYLRITRPDGSLTITTPEGVSIVGANPGIFAQDGIDPRPGYVYHAFQNGTGVVSVDGSITAGDIGTITVGASASATGIVTIGGSANPGDTASITVTLLDSLSNIVNTATYTYTVQTGDTLANVINGLVSLINTAPDPNVTANGDTTTGNIVLTAIVYGANGALVNYSAATSGGAVTATAGGTTLVVGTKTYSYRVSANDSLKDVVNNFVAQINEDPTSIVTAAPSNVYTRILLVAKLKGAAGEAIPITAAVPTGTDLILTALSSQTCCSNAAGGLVTDDNPAQPGEIVYIYATGLGLTTDGIPTGKVAGSDNTDQPVTPVDSILAGGTTGNILFTNYVPGDIGTFQVTFQLSTSLTTDPQTQLTIAQVYFVSNVVTFNVTIPSTTSSARKAVEAPKPAAKRSIPKKAARLPKALQRKV